MNFLLRKIMSVYVRRVQNSAKPFGGVHTWDFSQCVEPVNSIIGTDKVASDGICEMLSAKWIDEHAHERHLSTWLCTDGKNIDASKIRMLMQVFIIGMTMRPSKMVEDLSVRNSPVHRGEQNQDAATQNFLLSRGIIRRTGNPGMPWGTGTSAAEKIKHALGRDLVSSRGGTGSYRIIGIYGESGSGHCLACYTGLKDIAFFDPNFGEFWFEDKSKFPRWLAEAFFPLSHYTGELGKRYELFDYALKA